MKQTGIASDQLYTRSDGDLLSEEAALHNKGQAVLHTEWGMRRHPIPGLPAV